jgi:hypothetical protein
MADGGSEKDHVGYRRAKKTIPCRLIDVIITARNLLVVHIGYVLVLSGN